jgi:hypothetical protein
MGGWLVFSIPNLESLAPKSSDGTGWAGTAASPYLFPQQQLRPILEESGLRLVDRQNIAGATPLWNTA